jgi:hypothetical protein
VITQSSNRQRHPEAQTLHHLSRLLGRFVVVVGVAMTLALLISDSLVPVSIQLLFPCPPGGPPGGLGAVY